MELKTRVRKDYRAKTRSNTQHVLVRLTSELPARPIEFEVTARASASARTFKSSPGARRQSILIREKQVAVHLVCESAPDSSTLVRHHLSGSSQPPRFPRHENVEDEALVMDTKGTRALHVIMLLLTAVNNLYVRFGHILVLHTDDIHDMCYGKSSE